jgi:hypothetical protein
MSDIENDPRNEKKFLVSWSVYGHEQMSIDDIIYDIVRRISQEEIIRELIEIQSDDVIIKIAKNLGFSIKPMND